MENLRQVACGQTVKVKKISGEGPVRKRIMDMGITKGVEIFVRKVAPLGDPIEVIITSVAAYGLDKKWLGRKITRETVDELVKLNKKYGIHPAFEGGEAETLVLDAPMYDRRIVVDEADVYWDVDSGIYNITKAHLEEKYDYSLE